MDEAKILIADDSKMNQQILSEILGKRYDYLYADDGVQALDLLHEHFDIDLLLLDINMPHLDGFGVLEAMRQRNWLQDIPVIISSEDSADLIQKAYDLGVTDYIGRPFNLVVVQRRVSNTLALYARQKDLVCLAEEQVYEREKTNATIINILSRVVESKNFESGMHILHVRTITDLLLRQIVNISDRYPLSQADISMISTVSALHDIGKINIPAEILNKPGKLTRERCYKKAFSHETAMQMILNGECGAFNPLLLDCLRAVDDQLRTCMQHEPSSFDYQLDSQRLASEMLEQRSLPNDDRAQATAHRAGEDGIFRRAVRRHPVRL